MDLKTLLKFSLVFSEDSFSPRTQKEAKVEAKRGDYSGGNNFWYSFNWLTDTALNFSCNCSCVFVSCVK